VARKLKSARIVSTFLGAHALAPEFNTAASYLDYLSSKVLPAIKKLKLASRVDIFVENGYFSVDIARPYLKLAKQMGFDLTIHADQLTRSGGARLAMELGAKSADHLLCLDDKDISKIALSPVTCVALPTSDLYMRSAYPRTRELLDRGARVALATDLNPGTAPSQDLALTGLLARVRPEMQMSFAEVLVGYTVSAAYALGLESSLGSLEVGKSCDFSVLSGDLSGLFLEAGQMPIRQTFKEAGSVFGGNLSRKSKGSF
jgi:imidazolonepropionase